MDATRWSARALSACAVGAVVALAGTAHAGTGAFDDPIGDSTSVDISQVRVVHRNAVKVSVRSAVPLAAGQVYAFWIDTGRGPRPTYHVSFRANSDFDDSLAVVRSFGTATDARGEVPGHACPRRHVRRRAGVAPHPAAVRRRPEEGPGGA